MMRFPENKVFEVEKSGFLELALELFWWQSRYNPVYQSYIENLGIDPTSVRKLTEIPFLPIASFKTHEVMTTGFAPEIVFESSGTTGMNHSRHFVKDLGLYRRSFLEGFVHFYGAPEDWCIMGLLPSYLERSHSSLVWMTNELIRLSAHPDGGFYLYEYERLAQTLQRLEREGQKTMLLGVSFALLDLAEKYSLRLPHTVIVETGGMKGRRKEMIREELHALLTQRLGVGAIHAEYGMTELLSQAWSSGKGQFEPVPWMKALVRKEDDPFDLRETGEGILNIIDLANIYSCAFLATEDLGSIDGAGVFEILGRVDNSDIRGCSLLLA